jgi:recombination protein RecR
MSFSPLIQELINALRYLPGVGPRSAQRMALHLLKNDRSKALDLAGLITKNAHSIQYCHRCQTLSEVDICQLCSNHKRNHHLLCIVESPADIFAIEQTSTFNGIYFVLKGLLSPIDGIGPDDIGIQLLKKNITEGDIKEVILALNPTVEGQTTSHYIASLIRPHNIHLTRIAHGIPLGSELEYTDGNTLAHALMDRIDFATTD